MLTYENEGFAFISDRCMIKLRETVYETKIKTDGETKGTQQMASKSQSSRQKGIQPTHQAAQNGPTGHMKRNVRNIYL